MLARRVADGSLRDALEYTKGVKGDPLARAVALREAPGAPGGTAQPPPLIVLTSEDRLEQSDEAVVAGIPMGSESLEGSDQVPGTWHGEREPAAVLTIEVVPCIQESVRQALDQPCGLSRAQGRRGDGQAGA